MKPRLVLTGEIGNFDASMDYVGWYRDVDRNDHWWFITNGKAYLYRVQYRTSENSIDSVAQVS